MRTYTQTERNGKKVLHISLMPDPFFLSFLTTEESYSRKQETKREQTEAKHAKPTPKDGQNVQNESNYKEYHRRAIVGAPSAI